MGCEATHRGREREKTENAFSGFIPLVPRKGFSPHIPASRLFVLFHPTQATIPPPSKPHQIKQPLSKIAVNERALLTARLIFLSLENKACTPQQSEMHTYLIRFIAENYSPLSSFALSSASELISPKVVFSRLLATAGSSA